MAYPETHSPMDWRALMSRSRRALVVLSTVTLALLAVPVMASGDVGPDNTISALAGTHVRGFAGDGGPALSAQLNQPRDTAVGPNGEIYIADTFNNRIRVIAPNGLISTFAGNGSSTPATDPDVGDGGPAVDADINWPHDVFADAEGNVFIADSNHNRLRQVTPDGIIHTVAGTGAAGAAGDGGPAVKARLKNPKTVFRHGNDLYTAGLDNKVRVVHLDTGIIDLVAGTGAAGYVDGAPGQAQFSSPQRLQVDSEGNVYLADTDNSAIRYIDAISHQVSTVVGGGLATPRGIALEGDDTLYIADSNHQQVKKVDLLTGTVSTIAGSSQGFAGNGGPAVAAKFYQPRGLTVAPSGDLLVADTFNDQLRVITAGSTPPPPPPPTELLTNNSVESGGTPFLGKYNANSVVTWSDEQAQDGLFSIKVVNSASTAKDTGLVGSTRVPTTGGTTYTGSAWVQGVPGQRVAFRIQECPSTGCLTAVATKASLTSAGWQKVTTSYTSKQGAPLKYGVVAYALAPATPTYADSFSLTHP